MNYEGVTRHACGRRRESCGGYGGEVNNVNCRQLPRARPQQTPKSIATYIAPGGKCWLCYLYVSYVSEPASYLRALHTAEHPRPS